MNSAENKTVISFTGFTPDFSRMQQRPFLTAEWNNLIMVNFPVDAGILKRYIPYGTEPDFLRGQAFVSLVGFRFNRVRIHGLRIPFHEHFEEVNLRFYVRRKVKDTWKRGVVFISEIVPRRAIALTANILYHEKYRTLSMRSAVYGRAGLKVVYEWKFKGAWNHLSFRPDGAATVCEPESEATFITEHYWGYNRISETKTTEYEVVHEPWKVYTSGRHELSCRFGDLYGPEWKYLETNPPSSVFMAVGSGIRVMPSKSIQAAKTQAPST